MKKIQGKSASFLIYSIKYYYIVNDASTCTVSIIVTVVATSLHTASFDQWILIQGSI